MATRTWEGTAAKLTEVYTETIGGTWADGSDTWTGTINGNDLVVTFGTGAADATTDIATAIVAAWNGTTLPTGVTINVVGGGPNIPEFNEITASVSGSVVTFTHDTAGVPFTMTSAKSSTSGTVSLSNTVNATGPNDWANADNWAEGSVPVNSDDVVIDAPIAILYGLAQSGVTLTSLTIGERFTSTIGLPERNANGYAEYRDKYLAISATTLTIKGSATRCRINLGSAQTAATVTGSGTSSSTGLGAIQLLGTHASNTLKVEAGDVSVASIDNEVSTFATVTQSGGTLVFGAGVTLTNVTKTGGTLTVASSTTTLISVSGTTTVKGGTQAALTIGSGTCTVTGSTTVTTLRNVSATVTCGPSVSLTTVDSGGGVVTLNSGCTTLTSDGGTMTVTAGGITTVNVNGGTFAYGGTGTLGTVNWANCTLDFNSGTTAGCTVTTLAAPVGNCTYKDQSKRVTITNNFPTPGGTVSLKV